MIAKGHTIPGERKVTSEQRVCASVKERAVWGLGKKPQPAERLRQRVDGLGFRHSGTELSDAALGACMYLSEEEQMLLGVPFGFFQCAPHLYF